MRAEVVGTTAQISLGAAVADLPMRVGGQEGRLSAPWARSMAQSELHQPQTTPLPGRVRL